MTEKYGIQVESTDHLYLTDDGGDIGGIYFDYNQMKYVMPPKRKFQ